MEHGFYHPSRGYWQIISDPVGPWTVIVEPAQYEVDDEGNPVVDEWGEPIIAVDAVTRQTNDIMETYPPGTIEVPLKPGADYEWQNGAWVHVPPTIDLIAYVAQKRWEKEVVGIEVNGQTIDTSRESQSMITGAYAYTQANPSETIQFKATSGWVTLDAPTMAAIATAVGAHVQACFALEASVASQITNGIIATPEEIDLAFA